MSDTSINLTPEVYEYFQKKSLREPEILQKLRVETHKLSMGHMQICPEQGQFFSLLIRLMNAKKTLDIGVFTGYSALSVALALPSDGKVIACDINPDWTKMARKFWTLAGVQNKIDLILAPALETLHNLLNQNEANTFDFIFIDADKENLIRYYDYALQLVRIGGLIAIDNVLWHGQVADPDNNSPSTRRIRELNDKLLNDERIILSMLPIGDGLTLALKN